jgi:hypothetical protein
VRKAWQAACRAAGVPGRWRRDMRRSPVRNLERDGVSRSAAIAMVGHTTESIYQRYTRRRRERAQGRPGKIDATAVNSPDVLLQVFNHALH